jgi:hypothetical protein
MTKKTKLTLVGDKKKPDKEGEPTFTIQFNLPQAWDMYQERFQHGDDEMINELLERSKYLRASYWLFKDEGDL